MTDFAARHNMVESQLRPNRVTDETIIEAMRTIPREAFLPARLQTIAYVDEDLPLGNGRFVPEPLVLARLLQAAAIGPDDAVLMVGSNVGYGAAIASRLARRVVALECEPSLHETAAAALVRMGSANVECVVGELAAGWPTGAPYAAIVLEGAIEVLPDALVDQLADGGRLTAVVRVPGTVGRITLCLKTEGALSRRVLFDAATLPLPGFLRKPAFVF